MRKKRGALGDIGCEGLNPQNQHSPSTSPEESPKDPREISGESRKRQKPLGTVDKGAQVQTRAAHSSERL